MLYATVGTLRLQCRGVVFALYLMEALANWPFDNYCNIRSLGS